MPKIKNNCCQQVNVLGKLFEREGWSRSLVFPQDVKRKILNISELYGMRI